MTPAFIHEQGVGMDFKREGQRDCFTPIKIGGKNGSRDGRCLLLPNPNRQVQSLEAGSLTCEAFKLGGDFHGNDDFVKETREKFDLSDSAEVEQHRRVSHDDHLGNRALSEARSSSKHLLSDDGNAAFAQGALEVEKVHAGQFRGTDASNQTA